MKKFLSVFFSLFMLCSCAPKSIKSTDSVYTTFYAMYDFTREIAGDKLNVVQLVPSGSGPHDFEPTATDIAKLTTSKALIYCGSVDTYIDGIKNTVEKSGVKTLDTSAGIELINNSDPHVWLDPNNALKQYTAIAELLSEIDPKNSAYYNERLNSVQEQINTLDSDINTLASEAANKDIIVSHAAYGYLCRHMGITEHSIESNPGDNSDPTAKHMADIISFIRDNNIQVVFAQKNESDKTAQAIVSETGGEIMLLDPFEADTGSGNYFSVMRENINALSNALK